MAKKEKKHGSMARAAFSNLMTISSIEGVIHPSE
jgi:hypothetical protein